MEKIKRLGVVVFASDDSGAPRYYIFKRSFSSPRHQPSPGQRPTNNHGVKRAESESERERAREREREREREEKRGTVNDAALFSRDTLGIPCVTLDVTNASY